jgi:DNA repair exonuclease SbcCD ATPase subunit
MATAINSSQLEQHENNDQSPVVSRQSSLALLNDNGTDDVTADDLGASDNALAEQETRQFAAQDDAPAKMSADDLQELERIVQENVHLRVRVAELEKATERTVQEAERLAELVKDQERILEEKSDVIRELHVKNQELQGQAETMAPSDKELLALSEELEQERRQLKEDEEALMKQMRDMEVQMSRERAELARHRSELQRLHHEVRHELDLASRQSELRERLQPLQRRYQDLARRKGAEPVREAQPLAPQQAVEAEPEPPQKTGILRRIFGE